MTTYYILTADGTAYELDATTDINYTEDGSVTTNVVESGDSLSDHYINNPVMLSLQGVITDIKSVGRAGTTRDYIKGLVDLKKSKAVFSVVFGQKVGVIGNCLFTKLEFSQTGNNGSSGAVDSFRVQMTIQQIRLARQARITTFRSPIARDDYQTRISAKKSTDAVSTAEQDLLDDALDNITGRKNI